MAGVQEEFGNRLGDGYMANLGTFGESHYLIEDPSGMLGALECG